MAQQIIRRMVLFNGTVTTSATGADINIPQGFSAAVVTVTTSTTSGTSPTFDVFIQKQLPQAAAADLIGNPPSGTAIFDDILHFTQITANATRIAHISTAMIPSLTANATVLTTADWLQQDAALTAANERVGPIGGDWRAKITVGGTSPSTFLSVVAEFLPYGG
jgi:hypothetical protein